MHLTSTSILFSNLYYNVIYNILLHFLAHQTDLAAPKSQLWLFVFLWLLNGEYSVKSSCVLSGLLGSHGVFAFLCAQLYVICRLTWILHMLMLKSCWLVCFPNLTQMVCLVLSVTFCIFKLADVLVNKEFRDWLESL